MSGPVASKDSTASLAERLGEFTADIAYARLPSSTVVAVKRLLLDTLGCALGALDAEPVRLLAPFAPRLEMGASGATLLGSGLRSTAEGAAMINGALVRYLDFLDVYWSRDVCHPAENIPIALACVEEAGGGGIELIEAIVAGYEAQIRLCDAFSFQDRGFHHVSAAGFVTPLVAGKAWRQAAHVMAHGSVLGGSRHLTLGVLSKGRLSMAKAVGYPLNGAQGITSARLAGVGFTGPLGAYEWLFEKTAGARESTHAVELDHDAYRIERVSLKEFPVQYALQAPVAAAVRLHEAIGDRFDSIRSIRVSVRQETLARAADPAKFKPANRETADHSLPCCVAMALCDGALTEAMFHANRFMDQDVLRLTALVEPLADAEFERRFPTGRPGAVEVVFNDGQTLSAREEVPLGDRERPMTDAVVKAKFMTLAVPAVGETRAAEIAAFVDTLQEQANLGPLLRACRARSVI
jgi:2-methylcitrate dehydratase